LESGSEAQNFIGYAFPSGAVLVRRIKLSAANDYWERMPTSFMVMGGYSQPTTQDQAVSGGDVLLDVRLYDAGPYPTTKDFTTSYWSAFETKEWDIDNTNYYPYYWIVMWDRDVYPVDEWY
jgi:hypothetical protein